MIIQAVSTEEDHEMFKKKQLISGSQDSFLLVCFFRNQEYTFLSSHTSFSQQSKPVPARLSHSNCSSLAPTNEFTSASMKLQLQSLGGLALQQQRETWPVVQSCVGQQQQLWIWLSLGPCAASGLLSMGVLPCFWWGFPRVWHQHQIPGQSYHGNTLKPGFHNTAPPSASLHPSTSLSKLPLCHQFINSASCGLPTDHTGSSLQLVSV